MSDKCFLFDSCSHCDCDKNFCLRKYKLESLYNNSLLTDFQKRHISLKIDADGTDLNEFKQLAEIERNIVQFVSEGKNLYIHSANCGNGKSSWAVRMIQTYFDNIWVTSDSDKCYALFVEVPRYLQALKDNISSKSSYAEFVRDNIEKADLVIWDDIANKYASDYDADKLFTALNPRLNAGKANIFTSNCSPKEIYQALGERLASRICNSSTEIILHGADKRYLGK